MKLPVKGSRGEQVLRLLYSAGPCAADQVARRHEYLGLAAWRLAAIYKNLVASGCAELKDGVYSIRQLARRYFDQLEVHEPRPAAVAGPAYRPQTKPLDVSRTCIVATREGALDYRKVPSLVGSTRVPFKGGRAEDVDGVA